MSKINEGCWIVTFLYGLVILIWNILSGLGVIHHTVNIPELTLVGLGLLMVYETTKKES